MQFIIFFVIIIAIFSLINYYILKRALQAFSKNIAIRRWLIAIVLFFSLSFLAGRVVEYFYIKIASDLLIWTGAFWIAAAIYLFIFILLIDIIRGILKLFKFKPRFIYDNYEKFKLTLFIIIAALTLSVLIYGRINALTPIETSLDIYIDKKAGNLEELNIILASDIHLGTLIGKSRLEKLIELSNKYSPDIVLLAGDIIDEDIAPVIRQKNGNLFQQFKTKYGIYAAPGNHEHIGGLNDAVAYLRNCGVNVLIDSAVLIDSSFYIIGRDDKSAARFTNIDRRPLCDIIIDMNKDMPLILIDHQPIGLEEAAGAGIDLQVSGHTHHGQIWPGNIITNAIYELSWGYLRKGASHFYVSSGFGGWGPPIRTGSSPEIVYIKIKFKKLNK